MTIDHREHLWSLWTIETIEHFLLRCDEHAQYRNVFKNMLTNIWVELNLKSILGGGNFSLAKQVLIVE